MAKRINIHWTGEWAYRVIRRLDAFQPQYGRRTPALRNIRWHTRSVAYKTEAAALEAARQLAEERDAADKRSLKNLENMEAL